MEIFLDWVDKEKKTRLEVFSNNDSAIGFYEKHGFLETDAQLEPFREVLPCIEMVRPADVTDK